MISIGGFPGIEIHPNQTTTQEPDGINTVFGVPITPKTEDDILVFRNGMILHLGSSHDYTLSGSNIYFNFVPQIGEHIHFSIFNVA